MAVISTPILAAAAAVALGSTLVAALPGDAGPISGPGSLTVTVADAPGDIDTPVVVTGPDGFRVETERTTVLRNLRPGDYTVSATTVPNPFGELVPQLADQTVRVGPNLHRGVAVTYRFDSPPLVPVGDPASYAIQSGTPDNPVRWNPCRVVTWGPLLPLPVAEEQRLTSAFAKASIASGIPFRRALPGESPMVNVTLTFEPGDTVSGEGTMFFSADSADTFPSAFRGEISGVIGTETSGELREALYLHEIGHVLGITHVEDSSQVMHSVVTEEDAFGFATGDTNGLRLVGAEAGCLDRPIGVKDARAVESDGMLNLTWFQPASVPPVVDTRVEMVTRNPGGSATTVVPWPAGFVSPAAGPSRATMPIPPDVCDPNSTISLVATNANGSTTTPIRVTGC